MWLENGRRGVKSTVDPSRISGCNQVIKYLPGKSLGVVKSVSGGERGSLRHTHRGLGLSGL